MDWYALESCFWQQGCDSIDPKIMVMEGICHSYLLILKTLGWGVVQAKSIVEASANCGAYKAGMGLTSDVTQGTGIMRARIH